MLRLRQLTLVLAATSLVTATSCSRLMHNGADQAGAQVIFVNQSLDQADVFVVTDAGSSQRIGTVFAGRTETLDVPANILARGGTVNIAARLLARSLAPRTGPLTLTAGERLQVTLPSNAQTLTVLPAP